MKLKSKKPKLKVLVAMSGGVDSSVAALLMKEKGYEVIGVFMKNWSDTKNDLGKCTWKDDRREAMKIASKLKIPLITLDFEKEYRKEVVDEMFKLYKKGITPNPDVDCNNKIKFPLLRKAAKKLGVDYIVTGHYVRVKKKGVGERLRGRTLNNHNRARSRVGGDGGGKNFDFQLLRAKDESKDQSYFLYRLSQEDLKNSLFPIGDLTKKKVREIAKKNNFPNYDRKGTVGICFIGKVNLKDFLQKRIKPKKGKILNPKREIIGEHDGIYYYTIGQKIGPKFGIDIEKNPGEKSKMKKWYVAKKDLKKNEIVAAPEGHEILFRKNIIMKNVHWINKSPLTNSPSLIGWVGGNFSTKVHSRIRQVGELLPSKLEYDKKKKQFKVTLKKAITGVSEGQAIVLYKGKKCLGGGVIGF